MSVWTWSSKRALSALLLATGLGAPGAMAFDTQPLPQTCRDTLAQMQSDKTRFGELGKAMTRARKAADNDSFCQAAREIVVLIKGQGSQLDYCIGDLGSATDVPEGTAAQMIGLKDVYRQMLEAAKNPKNDRFHCGLSDQ